MLNQSDLESLVSKKIKPKQIPYYLLNLTDKQKLVFSLGLILYEVDTNEVMFSANEMLNQSDLESLVSKKINVLNWLAFMTFRVWNKLHGNVQHLWHLIKTKYPYELWWEQSIKKNHAITGQRQRQNISMSSNENSVEIHYLLNNFIKYNQNVFSISLFLIRNSIKSPIKHIDTIWYYFSKITWEQCWNSLLVK